MHKVKTTIVSRRTELTHNTAVHSRHKSCLHYARDNSQNSQQIPANKKKKTNRFTMNARKKETRRRKKERKIV